MTLKLCPLIDYKKKKIFMKKSCGKYATEASPRPLFYFVNNPKQPLHAENSFENAIF